LDGVKVEYDQSVNQQGRYFNEINPDVHFFVDGNINFPLNSVIEFKNQLYALNHRPMFDELIVGEVYTEF